MQIGVLGNENSWYVNALCECAHRRGHNSFALQFPELQATISGGKPGLKIGEIDVTRLDVLIVRTMPPGSLEEVVSRMDFLAGAETLGVRVVNSPKAMECAVDKYLTTQRLAFAGLPVPDTIVCESSETAMVAFEQLGGDIVVKPLFGAEGRGILRVDHPEMALRTFRTLERLNATLYLQRFLKGQSEDIRILLLKDTVIASMKRKAAEGDFRANAAQQASVCGYEPSSQEIELARRAAVVTGCDFAGIDLMYNEQGQPVVIEVNAVPGWRAIQKTCDTDIADRFVRWLEQSH